MTGRWLPGAGKWPVVRHGLLVAVAVGGLVGLSCLPASGAMSAVVGTWTTPTVLAAPNSFGTYDAGVVSSATRSVLVWGSDSNLYASPRSTDATSFPPPTLVGSGGPFAINLVQPALGVTGTPAGLVLAAWVKELGSGRSIVMVSTLPPGGDKWSTTQLAKGQAVGDVRAAAGNDGTLAVTWTADQVSPGTISTDVYAAIRPAGASSWTSPVKVSDEAAIGNVYPLNQNALATVTDDGSVTVVWGAEDGTMSGNVALWRERASTWASLTRAWSAPVWVSPPGQDAEVPALAASGQTVGAIWDATDNAGHGATDTAILSGGTWQAPVSLVAAYDGAPAIAPGPGSGELTAGWAQYIYNPGNAYFAVEASTWDSGKWSANTAVVTGGDYGPPTLAANGNGDVTAAWPSYNGSSWTIEVADKSSGSVWSAPQDTFTDANSVQALSEDPSGYLTVEFTSSGGSLEAAATTPPPLINVKTGSITGTADVGQTLKADPGIWSPAPQVVFYQWNRNGQPVPGATTPRYQLTAADLSAQITVTITARRTGSGDGSATYGPDHIGPGTFKLSARPSITGRFKPRSQLTAHPGTWTPAPATIHYQWLLNGRAIRGATRSRLTVRRSYRGKLVSVRVTVTRRGYRDAKATSESHAIR